MGRRELTDAQLILRPARDDDADLLLTWANDSAVRAASLHREPIQRSTHVAWLAARLTDPGCRMWIGEVGGAPVGVVRLQLDEDGRAVVSIAVDRGARGRGVGRALLRSGLAAARAELRPAGFRAWVRTNNTASIALFASAGFRPAGPATPDPGRAPNAPQELLLDDAPR